MRSAAMPGRDITAALHDVDAIASPACVLSAAGPQRKVTHLALDAAGDGAAPTRAHALRAQFVEHELARPLVARVVLRGEWPPHGAAYGG
mgnify:CR=1 FL=1